MAKTQLQIKGVKEALSNIKRLAREYPKAAAFALNRQGEIIMTDSKTNYVPVKDGPLRGSGHVVTEKEKIRTTLGFGGPAGIGNQGATNREDVGYAVVQHERADYQHTVGEDKYLEKPFMKAIPTLGGKLASDIREKAGVS